jgi:hypothetical protein
LRIYLNGRPLELLPGMRVHHALIRGGLLREIYSGKKVFDAWGNEVDPDGALEDDMKLWVR